MSVIVVSAPNARNPSSSRISASSSATPLTSTTIRGRSDPSRRRIIRSVPPASGRASAPCPSIRAMASSSLVGRSYAKARMGPALEHPVHLVEEHLRRRGANEVVRPIAEAPDEVGASPPQIVRVHERHRKAGREDFVQQEVVLQRVERLELALERDHFRT